MITVFQSQSSGLAGVQQLTPFLFLLTLILKVGVGRVSDLCIIMSTCIVRFDLNGVKYEIEDPTDPVVPNEDSDKIVIQSFAKVMIKQVIDVLFKPLEKGISLENIEVLYDKKRVLHPEGTVKKGNYEVKIKVLKNEKK